MTAAVTVLFLGGLGRSGTTLIERVLARADGVHAVGELVFLWERALAANERCGCGEPFDACPFWQAVGKRAFGGWDRVDPVAMRALQARVDRNRFLPLMAAPWLSRRYRASLERYAGVLARIYAAVAEETGAAVLVDSSKHASTAALLRHVPGVDARVVQVVRDPRGVAYSWSKVVERPDATGETSSTMARLGSVRVAARWLLYDVLLEVVRRPRTQGRFRYEDFVADPPGAVGRLLAFAGLSAVAGVDMRGGAFGVGGATVELEPDHTVAGNPLRFRVGTTEIRSDDEWRERLPRRDHRIVSLVTWPLRAVYGYR